MSNHSRGAERYKSVFFFMKTASAREDESGYFVDLTLALRRKSKTELKNHRLSLRSAIMAF